MTAPNIAIIGSGFGGLAMAYYLKQAGLDDFTVFEKAADLGGVWRENTYPGAACDVPSHLYSFSFEPHYPWSRRYGPQAEIHAYQQHVSDTHGLRRHFRYGHELAQADYDETRGVWKLRFVSGASAEAQILISAVGQLNRPQIPDIPGRDSFKGRSFHSATWDHAYDFNGKTVAVIGTGASAAQFVPEIAKRVKQLHVLQRSPTWILPKIDKAFSAWQLRLLKKLPLIHDLDRGRIFVFGEFMTAAISDSRWFKWLTASILKLWAHWHRWVQVRNPELRKKLTPDTPIGCKRTLFSSDWFPALSRPNVELVTADIERITATGVQFKDGRHCTADAIVWGTGFAATEFLAPMELRGVGGQSLRALWKDGAHAYRGVAVTGFPNFFMLYGPNTNCGGCSIIYLLEQQARYIVAALRELNGRRSLCVHPDAHRRFNEEIEQRNRNTNFEGGCRSWYINAQGRNTNNWVGYSLEYRHLMQRPNWSDFEFKPA